MTQFTSFRSAIIACGLVAALGGDVRRAEELPAIDVSAQLINVHDAPGDPNPGATVRFTWKTQRAKRVLIAGNKAVDGFHPIEGSVDVPGGATLSFTALGPGGITAHVIAGYPVSKAGTDRNGKTWSLSGDADLSTLFPNPYETQFASDAPMDIVRRRAIDVAQELGGELTPISAKNSAENFAAIREQAIEPSPLCEGDDCTMPIAKRHRERAVTFRIWIQRTPADARTGRKPQFVVRIQSFVKSRLRKVGGEWVDDKTDTAAGIAFAKFFAGEIKKGV